MKNKPLEFKKLKVFISDNASVWVGNGSAIADFSLDELKTICEQIIERINDVRDA